MNAHDAGRAVLTGFLLAATLATGTAAAETGIRFSLDFKFEGPSAPFLLPLDKGYYKAEGLNVTIESSSGSAETIQRVASGAFDMGFADLNALIRTRDASPETPSAIFMVYNRPAYSIVARKSRGISKPKDLEGKTLGAPALDNAYAAWPIFVKANGIDAAKVKIENVGFPVREPMLAAGQVDAITGLSYSTYVDLTDQGVPVDDMIVMRMADYGVDLYGSSIIVNPKFAADHPDAIKGFLRAFLKGLKETVKSPGAAIDSVLKRNDAAKKPTELERLTMAIQDNIVTPEVRASGYGGIDGERFSQAIDQIGMTHKFKGAKPKPGDIFNDSYLPAAAERKFN